MKKECSTCARYGECKPDKCNPEGIFDDGEQYRLYFDSKDDLKKYCYLCGKKLKRQPTIKISSEYRQIPVKCPEHGIVGYIEEGFRRKSVKV